MESYIELQSVIVLADHEYLPVDLFFFCNFFLLNFKHIHVVGQIKP